MVSLQILAEQDLSNILQGHFVADLRVIFRIIPSKDQSYNLPDCFLTYVQCFDITPQHESRTHSATTRSSCPEPSSSLYVLKRAKRSNGSIIGDVVPLRQIRALVDLVPRFYETAPRGLTDKSSSIYSTEFFLNKYFDKEMFWALHN